MALGEFPSAVRPLWQIKAKRFLRDWLQVSIRDFLAPLTDDAALLNLLALIVVTYLAALGGLFRLLEELQSVSDAIAPLIWTMPLYLLICIIRGPFRVRAEEKILGQWAGNRFVFHSPKLVFQKQISANESKDTILFCIHEAEPGGGVELRTEVDNWDQLCLAQVAPDLPAMNTLMCVERMPVASLAAVTKSKRFRLLVEKRAPSNATVVRVFLHSIYLPQ